MDDAILVETVEDIELDAGGKASWIAPALVGRMPLLITKVSVLRS